jgi:hypothetical protein
MKWIFLIAAIMVAYAYNDAPFWQGICATLVALWLLARFFETADYDREDRQRAKQKRGD